MPYTIIKSDGSTLTTIADGFLDGSASLLSLPGPNYVGYGAILNENLVHLLESFASNAAPLGTSMQGQLWFNKTAQTLNVFTDQGYLPVAGITNASTQPLVSKNGDIWFNTTTNQTFLYDNAIYKLVGPQYTKQQGISGAIPVTVDDGSTASVTHDIIQIKFGNVIMATFNKDATFVPSPAIPGFPSINAGMTLNNTILGPTLSVNLIGDVTGQLTGSVTGNVVATTLSGVLTGNVNGNVSAGTVVATNLRGTLLSSSVTSTVAQITNFSTGNALITGGTVSGITNLTATTATVTNLYSSNITVTGGTLVGITNLNTVSTSASLFSTSNAQITGGNITVANLSSTIANITNLNTNVLNVASGLSAGNAQITGGNITNITNFSATTGTFANLSVANLVISSGSATMAAGVYVNLSGTNLSTGNARITGGNVSNVIMSNVTASGVTLTTATATTQSYNNNSTSLATTAFVQSVVPIGIIVMWGGLVGNIPTGWQLCNGSSGTPDLRDSFIVGAGATYAVGATGGNATITLGSSQIPGHTHNLTITGNTALNGGHTHTLYDPGHQHSTQAALNSQPGAAKFSVGTFGLSYTTGNISTGVYMDPVSDHRHTISIAAITEATGSDQPHENRPPYYALCYIQKIF